ncbi:MAG: glucose 1-dehydrogenase [Akkermansiaceae bacterium]|nr:glucose 1-dehydrogenase [Akkermansiaceae bacterium]
MIPTQYIDPQPTNGLSIENTPFSLAGKRALITGGGTGLGYGIATAMVGMGADVVLCSRDETQLQKACSELGHQASYRIHDVLDYRQADALIDELEADRPIDILVNNAGAHLKKPSEDVSAEEFQHILNVHLVGAHALTRKAGQNMLTRGQGSIIYIASMTSLFGIPYVTAYAAAKAGMLGVVRTLACEWGDRGVRVNAIAPGWIDSQMMRKAVMDDPERKAKILGRTPLKGFGQPEDIGNAAVYLCSDAAQFVTGVCLPVDGGASIGF